MNGKQNQLTVSDAQGTKPAMKRHNSVVNHIDYRPLTKEQKAKVIEFAETDPCESNPFWPRHLQPSDREEATWISVDQSETYVSEYSIPTPEIIDECEDVSDPIGSVRNGGECVRKVKRITVLMQYIII